MHPTGEHRRGDIQNILLHAYSDRIAVLSSNNIGGENGVGCGAENRGNVPPVFTLSFLCRTPPYSNLNPTHNVG